MVVTWTARSFMIRRREAGAAPAASAPHAIITRRRCCPQARCWWRGGQGSSGILSSAELYDPATGRWSSTGSFTEYLFSVSHTSTWLPNGRVLVAGGNSERFLTDHTER